MTSFSQTFERWSYQFRFLLTVTLRYFKFSMFPNYRKVFNWEFPVIIIFNLLVFTVSLLSLEPRNGIAKGTNYLTSQYLRLYHHVVSFKCNLCCISRYFFKEVSIVNFSDFFFHLSLSVSQENTLGFGLVYLPQQ